MPDLPSNAFRVLIRVKFHNLRMTINEPRPRRMDVKLAKILTEPLVLFGGYFLIAKEQHTVSSNCQFETLDRVVIKRL